MRQSDATSAGWDCRAQEITSSQAPLEIDIRVDKIGGLFSQALGRTEHGVLSLAKATDCKHEPGVFRPVIDRAACEGKADCVRVCPVGVFTVGTLPTQMRVGLGIKGTLKGFAHRWQQALLVKEQGCEGCGKCVSACPEHAISLQRA